MESWQVVEEYSVRAVAGWKQIVAISPFPPWSSDTIALSTISIPKIGKALSPIKRDGREKDGTTGEDCSSAPMVL